jgi:hypothetical protein
MPSLTDTEIGEAAERNAIITANGAQNLSDAALTSLITSLLNSKRLEILKLHLIQLIAMHLKGWKQYEGVFHGCSVTATIFSLLLLLVNIIKQ